MILRPLRFVVIRHGQTDANRDGIIAGRLEAQLTPAGRAAAQALAGRCWPAAIRIFASPQQRAQETARLAFPDHQIGCHPDLRERDWGWLEGRPVAELPPRQSTPPDGESWEAVLARVADAVRACQDQAGDALPVLVAHSGVIRALRYLAFGTLDGPSAANTTPFLYRPTATGGWEEIPYFSEDHRTRP